MLNPQNPAFASGTVLYHSIKQLLTPVASKFILYSHLFSQFLNHFINQATESNNLASHCFVLTDKNVVKLLFLNASKKYFKIYVNIDVYVCIHYGHIV